MMKDPVERALASLPVSEPSRQLDQRIDRLIASAAARSAGPAHGGRARLLVVTSATLVTGFACGVVVDRWLAQTVPQPSTVDAVPGDLEIRVLLMPGRVGNPFDFSTPPAQPVRVSVTTSDHQGDSL